MTVKNKIKISEIVGQPHLKHFNDKRTIHQIDKGGRLSVKSSKNEIKIPFLLAQDPTAEVVAVRKVYKDHRDTTFAGLKIGFQRLGWNLKPHENYPVGKNATLWMHTDQGNYVHFVGLNDYESSKGSRPTKLGNKIKVLWLFEITQYESEQEMTNVIANYVREQKDWFIILYEFNPPPKTSHWIYDWLKKMETRVDRDTYIQHTNYTDLPDWQQSEWLGDIALGEIEAMKEIDYEQYKSIYLGLPANLTGSVYKKFNEQIHVDRVMRDPNEYIKFSVGVDYGETDATVYTLFGILKGYKGARVIDTYYHKNGVSKDDKGIQEYAEDFFDFMEDYWLEFGKPLKVYVDSANKTFWKYLRKEKVRRGIGRFTIQPVNKSIRHKKETDAIEERIQITNLMFGADYLLIDKDNKELIRALNEAERDKNDNRKDDSSTNVDSLDSLEYCFLDDIMAIENAILRQRGYERKENEWQNTYKV
jgi:PBSX family phage terminase large subunit